MELLKKDLEKEEFPHSEQFHFSLGNNDFEIFNFSEPLKEKHIEELKEVFEIFSTFKEKTPLKKHKYLFFKDEDSDKKLTTGEKMNGNSNVSLGLITIFPKGQELTPHRIPEVSNFKGTLIHELSHAFPENLIESWRQKFGWELEENKENLSKGIYYKNNNPEKCITDLAKTSPHDDFCDSVVAAIVVPNKLDPKRLEFIKENIFGDLEEKEKVLINRVEKTQPPEFKNNLKVEDINEIDIEFINKN